jgi:hypothetical protein
MTRVILATILIAVMVLVAAATATAYQTHKVNYVKVGMTDDGRPIYLAIIQLNYMDADLAARLFGGTGVSGATGVTGRSPATQGYDGGANGRYGRSDGYSPDYGQGYGRGYDQRY